MITLPVKEPWYSMILSGEKREKYVEIKEFYRSRFASQFPTIEKKSQLDEWLLTPISYMLDVRLRNGYSASSPSFVAHCRLKIGKGRKEWGAEEGKTYYILEIPERQNADNKTAEEKG